MLVPENNREFLSNKLEADCEENHYVTPEYLYDVGREANTEFQPKVSASRELCYVCEQCGNLDWYISLGGYDMVCLSWAHTLVQSCSIPRCPGSLILVLM